MPSKVTGIRQRGNAWEYRFRYQEPNGKKHELTKGGFPSKEAAEWALSEVKRKHHRGAQADQLSITLLQYWDDWVELYKSGKHAPVTEDYYPTIRKHLADYFGPNFKLTDMHKAQWQRFINDFAKGAKDKFGHRQPRAFETVSKLSSYLSSMAESAIDDQILFVNFTHGAVNPGYKRTKASRDAKFLEAEDYAKLLDECFAKARLSSVYYYIIATGILTGARISEILGLTWDRIDFDQRQITIDRTWDYARSKTFAKTKNESSIRTIDITVDLVDLLRQLRVEQAQHDLKTGYRDDLQLVFRNVRNHLPGDAGINKSLKSLEQRLEIKDPVTFHGLRHTHVSYLLSKGVDIVYISHRLGHASIKRTLDTYAHLMKSYEQDQADKSLEALAAL
ncbi:site-specific integrase [Lacticaseibacillus jixiensis]|uniref:site-specific integrase n=1 Tax=Lacticaseibacillus jixiensis TaxID=3231926 RepID=UPI0036F44A36